MRLVIFIAAIVVLFTSSVVIAETGNRGYPLQLHTEVGSWFYASYVVKASDFSSNQTTTLTAYFDSLGLSNVAVIDFYVAINENPSSDSYYLGHKSVTSSNADVTFSVMIHDPTNSTNGFGDGIYTFGGRVISCTTCFGQGYDVSVQTQLQIEGVSQPFAAVHNPYTLNYITGQEQFGVPAAYVVVDTTLSVYVQLTIPTGYGANQVVMTYNLGSLPTTYTNVSIKYPTTPKAGSFESGAIVLSAGIWYLTPYCYSNGGSTLSSTCHYDFAIGLGSEPTGAANGLTVSILSVTILATIVAIINL